MPSNINPASTEQNPVLYNKTLAGMLFLLACFTKYNTISNPENFLALTAGLISGDFFTSNKANEHPKRVQYAPLIWLAGSSLWVAHLVVITSMQTSKLQDPFAQVALSFGVGFVSSHSFPKYPLEKAPQEETGPGKKLN